MWKAAILTKTTFRLPIARLFHGSSKQSIAISAIANEHIGLFQKTFMTTQLFRAFSTDEGQDEEDAAPVPHDRPFRVLGVQQIAIGHTERTALHNLWTMMLGIVPAETNIKMEKENVIEDILRVGVGETAVEIDLMTPIDPEKSPKVHGTSSAVVAFENRSSSLSLISPLNTLA